MPSPFIYNAKIWNANLWGGGQYSVPQYSTDTLAFYDSTGAYFSLSDNSAMILTDLRINGPTREIIGGNVPRDHGQYVNADYFRETVIEAEGIAKKSTAATLDAFLDTIKKNLRHREGFLDVIDTNSTVKRFVATMDSFDALFPRERYHITKCPWKARFRCKTPFGRSRDYNDEMSTLTSSPTNITIDHAGTIRALPVIIMIFDSASSVTVVNVKRVNAAGTTLEEVEYSGSISAADVLRFDSEEKTVTKNGTAVDYTGSFLTAEPGSNIFKFTITGSSFSAPTTVKWKTTYL